MSDENEVKFPEIMPTQPEEIDPEPDYEDPAPNPTAALAHDDTEHLDDVVHDKKKVYKRMKGPRGILDLTTSIPRLKTQILLLIKDNPELLELEEREFKTKHPEMMTLALLRLRKSFWIEFENAYQHNRKMHVLPIYSGIVNENTWYRIVSTPVKLAFVICPPVDYITMLKEAHDAGLNAIREILAAKVLDDDGYLIPKAAEAVIKAYALIDLRLKGAVVQRIDQRTINYNQNVNQNLVGESPAPFTMDEINKQLAETQKALEKYTTSTSSQTLIEGRKDLEIPVVGTNAPEGVLTNGVVYERN